MYWSHVASLIPCSFLPRLQAYIPSSVFPQFEPHWTSVFGNQKLLEAVLYWLHVIGYRLCLPKHLGRKCLAVLSFIRLCCVACIFLVANDVLHAHFMSMPFNLRACPSVYECALQFTSMPTIYKCALQFTSVSFSLRACPSIYEHAYNLQACPSIYKHALHFSRHMLYKLVMHLLWQKAQLPGRRNM